VFSFFLSALLWSFVLIIFNIYILRSSFLYILFYGGLHLNCMNFPHGFNAVLFVCRLMTKDVIWIQEMLCVVWSELCVYGETFLTAGTTGLYNKKWAINFHFMSFHGNELSS
jgi:hypothetical protein